MCFFPKTSRWQWLRKYSENYNKRQIKNDCKTETKCNNKGKLKTTAKQQDTYNLCSLERTTMCYIHVTKGHGPGVDLTLQFIRARFSLSNGFYSLFLTKMHLANIPTAYYTLYKNAERRQTQSLSCRAK